MDSQDGADMAASDEDVPVSQSVGLGFREMADLALLVAWKLVFPYPNLQPKTSSKVFYFFTFTYSTECAVEWEKMPPTTMIENDVVNFPLSFTR